MCSCRRYAPRHIALSRLALIEGQRPRRHKPAGTISRQLVEAALGHLELRTEIIAAFFASRDERAWGLEDHATPRSAASTWLGALFFFACACMRVSAERPIPWPLSLARMAGQYAGGIDPRRFISEAVDGPTPRMRATLPDPPNASKISETVFMSIRPTAIVFRLST